MLKRILVIAAGVLLGTLLSVGTARLASAWGFWPNRELDRASTRLKEVLQLVNENYVEAKPAAHAELATAALHGLAESLDPHSEFLEIKDNKSFEEELTGEFGGIGIQVDGHTCLAVVGYDQHIPLGVYMSRCWRGKQGKGSLVRFAHVGTHL
jgi:carboxyl-terminal processing protease